MATMIFRAVAAGVVGLIGFFLMAYALHPYAAICAIFSLSAQKLLLAALVGLAFAGAAAWRMIAGASTRTELDRFVKAMAEGNSLD